MSEENKQPIQKKFSMNHFVARIHYLAVLAWVTFPQFASATSHGGLENPLKFETLTEFLVALLKAITQIAFPIIVLFIVYIGFRFVQESAAGNAEKMKDLRGLLLWAIVGALIILGAQALAFAIDATVQGLSSGIR